MNILINKKIYSCLFLITILLITSSANADNYNAPAFEVEPYIQNTTFTSTTILWRTSQPAYAKLNVSDYIKNKEIEIITNKKQRIGSIKITGLKAGTKYKYTVYVSGNESFINAKNNKRSSFFKTFSDKPADIRFTIYGDSRGNPKIHRQVINGMSKIKNLDFILHTGDFVERPSDLDDWNKNYFKPAESLISHVPVFPVIGNHEDNSSLFFSQFSLPNNEKWYSVNLPDIHIIALDSNVDFSPGSSQYKWLISDLNKYHNVKWKVMLMHHPIYSSGPHSGVSENGFALERPIRIGREIIPMLAKNYGINIIFSGHDHAYERSMRDNTTYIVTGGGGAGLYSDSNAKYNQYKKVFKSERHFCVANVDRDNFILSVYSLKGKIIDNLILK